MRLTTPGQVLSGFVVRSEKAYPVIELGFQRHIDTIRPDMVKLDMGLTLGLTPDDARVAVVRAIVEQARAAGALTVAVGIESAAACLTLRELGVDLGQGYFLGRPQ